jgi:mRNA interferase HicA
MKRRDLLRHLEMNGCYFLREGAKHSIYFNPTSRIQSGVPRHSEIKTFMAEKICKELGVPKPHGKR